jgi:peptidoglycan/LPS O-acetylase OafA/YrhL
VEIKSQNSFKFFRLLLAITVIVSHFVILSGNDEIYYLTKYFDSDFAVKSFFVISGFFTFRSLSLRSLSIKDYYIKRIYRIYPAYIFAIVITSITIFLSSSLASLDIREIFNYFAFNLIFLNFIQPIFGDAFNESQIQVANGSLWTIKVEVMFYIIAPIILLMKEQKIKYILIFLIVFGISWSIWFSEFSSYVYKRQLSVQLPGQIQFFAMGAMIYLFIKKINFSTVIILLSIQFMLRDEGYVSLILQPISYSFLIIFLGNQTLSYFKKIPDISYGLYLFHFPIIQLYFDTMNINNN